MFRLMTLVVLACLCTITVELSAADPLPGSAIAQAAVAPQVEIVGICNVPLDDAGWWDEQGNAIPLEKIPDFAVAKPGDASEDLQPLESERFVLIKATVAATAIVNVQIPGQSFSIRLPEFVDGVAWKQLQEEAKRAGEKWQPLHAREIVYGIGTRIKVNHADRFLTAQVMVSDGEWKSIGARPRRPDEANPMTFELDSLEGELPLQLRDQAVRVMAEDKQGKLHAPTANAQIKAKEKIVGYQAWFQQPAAEIVNFHLQTRPSQTFVFHDVSLLGGKRSPADKVRASGGVFAGDLDVLTHDNPSDQPTDLDWCGLRDGDVTLIPAVPSLRRLYLASEWLTDTGVEHLAAADSLRHLRIVSPHMTGAALVHTPSNLTTLEVQGAALQYVQSADLAALPSRDGLQHFKLWSTVITDDNAATIAQFNQLESLIADGSQLTDAGLAELAKLSKLQRLDLGVVDCTTNGIGVLAKLTNLRELNVRGQAVNDDALEQLAAIASLERIDLRDCSISDTGIKHLNRIPGIHQLDTRGTAVTRNAYQLLKHQHPDIRIIIPDPPPPEAIDIEVVVRDSAGTPLEDANVTLFASPNGGGSAINGWYPPEQLPKLGGGATDDSGTYRTRIPPHSDNYIVAWVVTAHGGLQVATKRTDDHDQLKFELVMPAKNVRLKLVDAQGQPAVGVDVAPFRLAAGRFNQFEVPPSLLESLVWLTSDEQGRVTLPHLDPKKLHRLGFRSTAFGKQVTDYKQEFPEEEFVIELLPVVPVECRINVNLPTDFRRFEGVLFSTSYGRASDDVWAKNRFTWVPLKLSEDGRIVDARLGQGRVELADQTSYADADHQRIELNRDTANVEADKPAFLDLRLVDLIPVHGVVRLLPSWDSAAEFELHTPRADRKRRSHSFTTDRSGRFMLWIMPGEFRLDSHRFYENVYSSIAGYQWRNSGFGGRHEASEAAETRELLPLDLALMKTIRGRLVDAEGAPLQQSVYGFPTQDTQSSRNCIGTNSDKDGYFEGPFPYTHPPVSWRGSGDKNPYRVVQQEPLILTPDLSPSE